MRKRNITARTWPMEAAYVSVHCFKLVTCYYIFHWINIHRGQRTLTIKCVCRPPLSYSSRLTTSLSCFVSQRISRKTRSQTERARCHPTPRWGLHISFSHELCCKDMLLCTIFSLFITIHSFVHDQYKLFMFVFCNRVKSPGQFPKSAPLRFQNPLWTY